MIYQGSCHCGDITFEAEGENDIGPVVDCNCSYCSRKGTLLWFVPRDKLTLKTPHSAITTYHFNKHVIDHQFCKRCGCQPFGFGVDPQGNKMAAINVRCLDGIDLGHLKHIHYDGRSA
ncbi:aldehyde-activating protein [Herbaspirillum sp. meg3]|uniref:GFA family protein n=1 Tax=Herbaspirillum sp. meg3 TaxID=2025949 RepID=UPI000B9972B9|nr:GFA family protein [Herbaspirillum sp. meg3]ASU38134.1 aldehyde-activating protein [Herbaspirillum sp. meg3]